MNASELTSGVEAYGPLPTIAEMFAQFQTGESHCSITSDSGTITTSNLSEPAQTAEATAERRWLHNQSMIALSPEIDPSQATADCVGERTPGGRRRRVGVAAATSDLSAETLSIPPKDRLSVS